MTLEAVLLWLVFGAVVGIVARFLVPGADPMGWVGTIVLGIVGSFVGGFIAQLLFTGSASVPPPTAGWIGSIVGAIIVLLLWRASQGRSVTV